MKKHIYFLCQFWQNISKEDLPMKNLKTIVTFSIILALLTTTAIAQEFSREEHGDKMMHRPWCTEEFHTQLEFHKVIANLCGRMDFAENGEVVAQHEYKLVSGGNSWNPGYASPDSSVVIFLRTKILDGETVESVRNRLLEVAGITALSPDSDRVWQKDGNLSYLVFSD